MYRVLIELDGDTEMEIRRRPRQRVVDTDGEPVEETGIRRALAKCPAPPALPRRCHGHVRLLKGAA